MHDYEDFVAPTLDRRRFMKPSTGLISCFSLAPSLSCAGLPNKSPKKLNILLIIADQLTPLLTGLHGHPVVKTPDLNALAAKGVRFDAAYSPFPLRAPARACLLTGRYIYIHEHDEQLFDIEKDPGEWDTLTHRAECNSIREELKRSILSQFDPTRIESQLQNSLQKRQLLMKAMRKTGRNWAYHLERPL
jgi:hypothetical protein